MKKTIRIVTAGLLALALVSGALPAVTGGLLPDSFGAVVSAEGEISYVTADWDGTKVVTDTETVEQGGYTEVTESTRRLLGGAFVVKGNVTLSRTLYVGGYGDVDLILCDGATLTAPKGIVFTRSGDSDATLNIYAQQLGTGKLVTSGDIGCAGIGGSPGSSCGTINIYGGNINATGNLTCAGIGGGCGSGSFSDNGTVRIYGGTVFALGGGGAAGIGAGVYGEGTAAYLGASGIVEIYGGNVTAVGSKYENGSYEFTGAGIGGVSQNSEHSSEGGTFRIFGGEVHAEGGEFADGIGNGPYSDDHGVIELGEGIELETSRDNKNWNKYTGTRERYMRSFPIVVYTHHARVPATYTDEGHIEYWMGSDGHYYSDDHGTPLADQNGDNVVNMNDIILPKLEILMQADPSGSATGNLAMNIYIPIPEDEWAGDYFISLVNGSSSISHYVSDLDETAQGYVLQFETPAKNMRDEYALELQKGSETQATGYVSVYDYADTVTKGDYDDKVKAVCRSMLSYGAAAQVALNYKTGQIEGMTLAGEGADYSNVKFERAAFAKVALNERLEANDAPIRYEGMSLVLKHDPYLSLAFRVVSGTQDGAIAYLQEKFQIDQKEITNVEKNGKKFVVIKTDPVAINKLLFNYKLTYDDTVLDSPYTVDVNAGQYMSWAINNKDEDLAAVKDVCKALYNYYEHVTQN
ncbi:MAG: hypothetical protein IKR73_05750 [Oscillospiraceae bacterium]|nr:hypothetical protein [Oscillospiraceae bacterium]